MGLLMRTNEELASCSAQKTLSRYRTTGKLLNHVLPLYSGLAFHAEKAILKHFTGEVSKVIQFILELKNVSSEVKKENGNLTRAWNEVYGLYSVFIRQNVYAVYTIIRKC